MLKFLIIIFIAVVFSKIWSYVFLNLKLTKISYKKTSLPYSGGSALFTGIIMGLFLLYLNENISSFKTMFFSIIILTVYLIGLIDDIIGDRNIKGIEGNLRAIYNKKFSTGILKAFGILIISCYINFFFNEEFWILKGILTAIITNMFNLFDLRPGRCIKIYLLLFILVPLGTIRWTVEPYIISISAIAGYYFLMPMGIPCLGTVAPIF